MRLKIYLLALCTQLFSLPVWSSFEKGFQLYQNKQYEEAFKIFHSMAEIGEYNAMRNLGVMYFRGESVEKNPILGYAWVDTAEKALGLSEKRLSDTIFKTLSSDEKQQALTKAQEVYAQFNPEEISKRIFPTLLSDDECEEGPKPTKKVAPRYPSSAAKQGIMGQVMMEYSVTPEGYARDIMLLSASNKALVKAGAEAVRHFRYEPYDVNEKKIYKRRNLFSFLIPGDARVKGLEKIVDTLDKRKLKAENGTAIDQYIYADYLSNVHQMKAMLKKFSRADKIKLKNRDKNKVKQFSQAVELEYQEANKWLMASAKQGLPNAQFDLGLNMTQGWGCKTDVKNGHKWIEASAVGGYSPAQYMMGEKILQESESTAIHWLRNAATAGHYKAKLLLAWELSTSSHDELRDAKEALKWLEVESSEYFDNVRVYETLAAAYAEAGNFKKAVKFQKKAAKEAKRLDWEIPEIGHRLSAYQAKTPWRGHYSSVQGQIAT